MWPARLSHCIHLTEPTSCPVPVQAISLIFPAGVMACRVLAAWWLSSRAQQGAIGDRVDACRARRMKPPARVAPAHAQRPMQNRLASVRMKMRPFDTAMEAWQRSPS